MSNTPSRVVPRLEFHEPKRKPLRPTTPQRTTHSGMVYNSGMLHTGGRTHTPGPRDHNVLPGRADTKVRSTPIFSQGGTMSSHVALSASKPGATPRRHESPTPIRKEVRGRHHITKPDNGDVVGFTTPSRTGVRDLDQHARGKDTTGTPRNSHIVGLTAGNKEAAVEETSKPRARRYMEKAPEFKPDVFVPKSYTPQKRRDHRPADHGVLESSGPSTTAANNTAQLRQTTPLRTGRARAPAAASYNPITWQ